MSILINGIEMPRTHPITVEIYPNGTVLSKTVGRMDIHGKAVHVPPHGRLIDADALTLLRNITIPNCEFVGDRLMMDINMIDDAPTIIEASGEEVDATIKEET